MNNAHILLVEDNCDIRTLAIEYLEINGFAVTPTSNGKEAIERLKDEPGSFDIIILDSVMPVMTGTEFRKEQLLHPTISQIPVILLSSEADTPEIARKLDCDGWLYKMDFTDKLILEIFKVLWSNNRIEIVRKK